MSTEKYDPQAERWTEEAYADPSGYLAHRADLIASLGPPLEPGDTVLDLACGDAGRNRCSTEDSLRRRRPLRADGGCGPAPRGRARGDRARRPQRLPAAGAVACTTCFRAVYYARDRRELFAQIAGYTERKLVFDLNPRQYRVEDVAADLKAAGLARVEPHPFFFPQRHGLPRPLAAALRAVERSGPLAVLLRVRFSYLVSASREDEDVSDLRAELAPVGLAS